MLSPSRLIIARHQVVTGLESSVGRAILASSACLLLVGSAIGLHSVAVSGRSEGGKGSVVVRSSALLADSSAASTGSENGLERSERAAGTYLPVSPAPLMLGESPGLGIGGARRPPYRSRSSRGLTGVPTARMASLKGPPVDGNTQISRGALVAKFALTSLAVALNVSLPLGVTPPFGRTAPADSRGSAGKVASTGTPVGKPSLGSFVLPNGGTPSTQTNGPSEGASAGGTAAPSDEQPNEEPVGEDPWAPTESQSSG